jgi:NAD(P)-dependent dehydrogenase (short-subunit alcohol dehydrogenase family)
MRLAGKVALITGAGSGIGRAIAEAFAREGAAVVVADLHEGPAEVVAAAIRASGATAIAAAGDVGDGADAAGLVDVTVDAFGRIDVLVNNAAEALVADTLGTSEEAWDRVLATNLKSVFLLSKATLPHMIRNQHGTIVNVASQLAFVGVRSLAAYTASKGGVLNLTRSMALDHAHQGVRVNALCPGAVDTPLLRDQFASGVGPQGTMDDLRRLHPIGRIGLPEEMAPAAVFLASAESSFMTGASIVIDGGYIAS